VPNFIKEHVNTNFQKFGTALNLFSMEDNKNPLPFIDRNSHLPKQFLSLFYKWKALAHVKSLLPSMKGPIFYFYVDSSSSIFMHWLREHSCHSEYMIRRKCIYNFWCSMLVLHQLLCVLITLHSIFMHFLELTY
jgi:hypothetical protein